MRGVFLLMMMGGLLVASFLVMRDMESREKVEGEPSTVGGLEEARQATEIADQQTEEMGRKLRHALQE
jgi:hypothetical protein